MHNPQSNGAQLTLPPSAQDAEYKALSGAIQGENVAWLAEVAALGGDLTRENRIIAKAAQKLAVAGKPWDIPTITRELLRGGTLEKAGGPGYVTGLMDALPIATEKSFNYWLEDARDIHRHRREFQIIEDMLGRKGRGEGIEDLRAELNGIGTGNKAGPNGADYPAAFSESIETAGAIRSMSLAPRRYLLGKWLKERSLGFIYAPRGLGKTLLVSAIADAVQNGKSLGEWDCGDITGDVLIVDAEMDLEDTQARANNYDLTGIRVLHHQLLFDRTGKQLNLADPKQQDGITGACNAGGIQVLIIDNLSTAFFGIKENDSDSWEAVSPWLLQLRRMGITVIVVAHAGRNGKMRGTSRREDPADWVLKLIGSPEKDKDDDPAVFVTKFEKLRGPGGAQMKWEFSYAGKVRCQTHAGYEAFLELVNEGVNSNGELAEEMGISKAMVSKHAKRAEGEGRINIKGKLYEPSTI